MTAKLLICSGDLGFAENWRRFFHQGMGFEVFLETHIERIAHYLNLEAMEFCFVERNLLEPIGLKLLEPFVKKYGNTYFVVIGDAVDSHEEVNAILFGMKGFIQKQMPESVLKKLIARVREKEIWVDRHFVTRLLDALSDVISTNLDEFDDHVFDKKLETLTVRELEVAKLVCIGASNPRIGRILQITERTVKSHLSTVFQKLDVNDRLQLALFMSHAFHVLTRIKQK